MPVTVLAVELAAAVVAFGWIAIGLPDHGSARPWWFLAGVAVLSLALVSPVHGWSERSLAGHMVQHVLLVSLAAPLLAAAHPFATAAARLARVAPPSSTSPSRRDRSVDLVRAGAERLRSATDTIPTAGAVAAAGLIQVATLLGWHVPVLFDGALRHPLVHEVEHVTLLGSAFVLWALLLRASGTGAAVLALFVVTLPLMAYGVALTLARSTWYASYPGVRDQQLAGVVMWAYGGVLAVTGGVLLGVDWLRRAERADPGWRRSLRSAR
jgi:putative membrane protein